MSAADIVKALAVTAELTGTELSATALRVMAADLERFPETSVLNAMTRCRRELSGRLTLAAIIERVAQSDGRPSADEAWAIALDARDEALTVVWNNEISEAFATARTVLSLGDKTGARMAFKDAYERITRNAREIGESPKWNASLGWDVDHRRDVLSRAVETGLLASDDVRHLLPAPKSTGIISALLSGSKSLPAPETVDEKKAVERIKGILTMLRSHQEAAWATYLNKWQKPNPSARQS